MSNLNSVKMTGTTQNFVQPVKLEGGTTTFTKPLNVNATSPYKQAAGTSATPVTNMNHQNQDLNLLDKRRLGDLVRLVDSNAQLDDDAEEALIQIADDFIENVVTHSCQLAKHRKSNSLEAKDILLYLEKNYNMSIPGYSTDEFKSVRKPPVAEAHRQRLGLIKKTLKKY